MPMSSFSSPSDVRLITFFKEIFKIKVISTDIKPYHEEYFSNEVEQVVRALLFLKDTKSPEKVQTERFLFTIQRTRWKASEMLKFFKSKQLLRPHRDQIEITVTSKTHVPQTSSEIGESSMQTHSVNGAENQKNTGVSTRRKRIISDESTQPKKKTKYAEKPHHFLSVDMGLRVDCNTDQTVVLSHSETNRSGQAGCSNKSNVKVVGIRKTSTKSKVKSPVRAKNPRRSLRYSVEEKDQEQTLGIPQREDIENTEPLISEYNINNNNTVTSPALNSQQSPAENTRSLRRLRSHSKSCPSQQNTEEQRHTRSQGRNIQAYTKDGAFIQQEDLVQNTEEQKQGKSQARNVQAYTKDKALIQGDLVQNTIDGSHKKSQARNVQAYTKDRALIQQEDLEEEMKLQNLSCPTDTGKLSKEQKDSMLRTAMELIMTPVKLLFHRNNERQ